MTTGVGPALERDAEELIAALMPPGDYGVAACLIDADETGLPAEEAAFVRDAVATRRAEFAAGRRSARRALVQAGGLAVPIPVGRWRAPSWPPGFHGSISHDGALAAALAFRFPGGPLPVALDLVHRADMSAFAEILPMVRSPGDLWAAALSPIEAMRYFSAKEAGIKLASAIVDDWIDIEAICVEPGGDGWRVVVPGVSAEFRIRFASQGDVHVALGVLGAPA